MTKKVKGERAVINHHLIRYKNREAVLLEEYRFSDDVKRRFEILDKLSTLNAGIEVLKSIK